MTHDHTPGPLSLEQRPHGQALMGKGEAGNRLDGLCEIAYVTGDLVDADGYHNALRLAACWNACQGIPDPETELPKLLNQREEMAKALSYMAEIIQGGDKLEACEPWAQDLITTARQALARIEKGAPQG